jgi:hypothetical protein
VFTNVRMSLMFYNIFIDLTERSLGFFITSSVISCDQRVRSRVTVCYNCLFKNGSVLVYILFKIVNITFEARVIVYFFINKYNYFNIQTLVKIYSFC